MVLLKNISKFVQQTRNSTQMNIPSITCFSNNNENLKNTISEIHNYYGSVINQSVFKEELSLLHWLKNCNFSSQEVQLLVIDLEDYNEETIHFIDGINHFCPSAIKLIIAKKAPLAQIQELVENKTSLLFLTRPWTSNQMRHILKLASQTLLPVQNVNEIRKSELSYNETVEEKANIRLQKLIDANTAKDSFMSIIAHDLKSPFVALLGFSEILLNEWDTLDDATKRDIVRDLYETSNDTFKLLETLLVWSKLQKESLVVTVNEVKIHNLVDSALKASENNALMKGIKIENKIDDNLKIFTDKNMIATVFRNLISNAVKFTEPGGHIYISAIEEKDLCTFCVADSGLGVDKQHILDLFKKGSNKRINGNASEFKGLGLIISKDFVEKNGGKIWLETQKGQGSKFFFTIPC